MSQNTVDWLNKTFGFGFDDYDRPMTNEEKIDLLETKLQYCVDTENYERAARLRDEIKKLKNNLLVTVEEGIEASSKFPLPKNTCPYRDNQIIINSDCTLNNNLSDIGVKIEIIIIYDITCDDV